ncbi:MAG: S-adenosylmethionine:tRNA ribosyltransferase-isomerase [Bacteroidales bacterium]|nr:S-adenosylmethionine:tRNA ribosyltransferase-isomerase [Bacteroidales bacterium]MDZ4204570.1 S-adenosylmethionine:tRNA ribosyltransferase-isomerase [Bacteroidales bacterium]
MSDPRNIRIEDYDYPLADGKIAQYPLQTRDASRLLVCCKGEISEDVFTNLPNRLPALSLLVFNDTRVIRARFYFNKPSGARIEIFCLETVSPTPDLQLAFASKTVSHWKCYVGNLRRWKREVLQLEISIHDTPVKVWVEKTGIEKDTVLVKFSWSDPSLSFGEVMEACGHIPLPPYITRLDDENDGSRYQTIYASHQGSVAAPTAGLHFTSTVLQALTENGIMQQWVTLHVGAGTFKPVNADTIGHHDMHHEIYSVSRQLIKAIIEQAGRPIIPVGTTSMRTLESLYWLGVKILCKERKSVFSTSQWEPYETENQHVSTHEALQGILNSMDEESTDVLHASTSLLIAPGYQFRICKGLITNFHLPKSTLLLLVAALAGPDWKKAYQFALDRHFRFLSYGDSCLFLPQP